MKDFSTYTSPFSWRYGSDEMRKIFSEENKYKIWRKIWVALAKAQNEQGVVSDEELKDLQDNEDNVSIERIWEIEKDTSHDVVAAIKEFAEKAKIGGGKIHLGATSMDINDNGETIRYSQGLEIVESKLRQVIKSLAAKIREYSDTPVLAYTHLNPAEPTTLGYRFAFYAQDLLKDLEILKFVKQNLKAKGMKGAVGTSASYTEILEDPEKMETSVMEQLGLEADLISTQVYTRKTDYLVITLLNSIASSLAKFANDFRILQTPLYDEWSEPFGSKQVGSSAMPFKKNPLNSEKICGLTRIINQYPAAILENATYSYLERTLDDSSTKRVIMPESFLIVDEILKTAEKLISGMVINVERINLNLEKYGRFAATEKIIIAVVKKGADRQKIHEVLREISIQAWEDMQKGQENPLESLLINNEEIKRFLAADEIKTLLDAKSHVGNAPKKALTIVKKIDSLKS